METSLPSPKPQESLFCHGAKIAAAETPPDQAKASRMQNQQGYEGRTRMDRLQGKPIDRWRAASPFVIFVPFVVQTCDRTSILLQGNEINTKEPKSTKERDLPSWYGSVSAQSAAAENEKPLRTCSPAPSSRSRPTAIRLVGADLGSIGVEKTAAIGRYLGGSPVSAVHHHTVTTIFPTCWFDSR